MEEAKMMRGFKPVESEDRDANGVAVREANVCSSFYYKVAIAVFAVLAFVFFIAFSVTYANRPAENSRQIAPVVAVNCLSSDCVQTSARVLAAINQSVSPCEDFYQYACGGWLAANPVPDDKPAFGTFTWLSDKNQEVERKLLSANISSPTGAKASVLFLSCLDEATIDARGNTPILPLFNDVNHTFPSRESAWDQATDSVALSELLGRLHLQGDGGLFSSGVGPDDKNSSRHAMFLSQGGLMLPNRDYYFENASHPVLVAFQSFVATSFQLMGVPATEASAIAGRVLALETKLAEFTLPPDEMRDPNKLYNPRSIAALNAECPAINWEAYFGKIYGKGVNVTQTVVSTPAFFQNLTALVKVTPKATLVEYLLAHVIAGYSSYLSAPFRDNRFRFRKALYGIQTVPDRWKTCAGAADALGFAVGEAFVKEQFSKDARAAAEEILSDVTKAFSNSFESLQWMDSATKASARDKAARIAQKIGYPKWFDKANGIESYYAGLEAIGSQFFEGMVAVSEWQSRRDYFDLFEPVDRSKWEMFPQEVNAYYHPSYNEIVFPAGILQPPFFSLSAQRALNYGGIGAVMGHEISHAFDDQGAQYDADGNLKQWWSERSYDLFQNQTTCIANQYSKFTVSGPDGPVHVNGKLTLGENIADNGGVRAALTAYRAWVARNSPENKLPGLEAGPEQLFFLGYAQVWCQNARPDYAKLVALTDPHSPPRLRVNAVVMNSKEFASAFQCPIGSEMNPNEKCSVW